MVLKFLRSKYYLKRYSRIAQFIELNNQNDMTEILPLNSDSVNLAVKLLQKGDVIAIPTDTVYGLAADSRNCQSVQALYDIKGRNFNKPVAICVGNVDDIPTWGNVKSLPVGLLEELFPGPVTVLLQRTNATSLKLNPGVNKVGIRIPDSSFIRDVVTQFGFAIALTSANLSNSSSTLDPNEFKELWIKLGAVFDGGTLSFSDSSRAGSTIVDLTEVGKFKIIRNGSALKTTLSILEKFSLKQVK